MGTAQNHSPTLYLLGLFSRYDEAFEWTRKRAEETWGPVAIASPVYDFTETTYYTASMGPELKKGFFVFEKPFDPAELAEMKLLTGEWEEEFRDQTDYPEQRPLNLDPGYLTEAKLVLASTKDRDHRIYVGRGIFAEVTLHFHKKAWRSRAWTYPDYQRADFHDYFDQCRKYLRSKRSSS